MDSYVNHLFSVPVYESKVEEFTEEELSFIKNVDFARMVSKNGNSSTSFKILKCPELKRIKDQIENHVNFFVHDILGVKRNASFYTHRSWIVEHLPNDHAHMHIHPNSLLSGVLYIETYKDSGNLILHKPNGMMNLFPHAFSFEYEDKENNFGITGLEKTPENRHIIIFPSHIPHSVTTNLSGKNRYSLAFDFYAKGHYFENDMSEIYLP
jgi:uncharacterized protein (TIGR02466 family)